MIRAFQRLAACRSSPVARQSALRRGKERDGKTAEVAFLATEHGFPSATLHRRRARSRSRDYSDRLLGSQNLLLLGLLLGLLGLGAAASRIVTAPARVAFEAALTSARAPPDERAQSGLAGSWASRQPAIERERVLQGTLAAVESTQPERAPAPVKEREFLAAFRALEHARPGALEACAEDVLAGEGSTAEKVALLRALQASGSSEAVRWLEHAVRAPPDGSGPPAESLPDFALDTLARLAARGEAARAALARLAFDERTLARPLRRRAAAAFAGVCEDRELDTLRMQLVRAEDELLVAGALSALEPRRELAGVRRLLDTFERGSSAKPAATTEE